MNLDIVLTLAFSVVMIMFMAFPAMKIIEWIDSKVDIPEKWYNPLLITTTLFLSLLIGLFLRFA